MKKINTLYNCTGYPKLFESDSTTTESTKSESTKSESTSPELIHIDDIGDLEDKLVSSIRDNDTKKAEEIVSRIDELTLIEGNLQVGISLVLTLMNILHIELGIMSAFLGLKLEPYEILGFQPKKCP